MGAANFFSSKYSTPQGRSLSWEGSCEKISRGPFFYDSNILCTKLTIPDLPQIKHAEGLKMLKMEIYFFSRQNNWGWYCFSTMNGVISYLWIFKFQCDHHVAYEISYKTFVLEFAVFDCCAYGGQYHLNKYWKIWKSGILKLSCSSVKYQQVLRGPPYAKERWGPAWSHALHTSRNASGEL